MKKKHKLPEDAEMLPNVLVASPTSDKKDYCFLEWISHVRKIDYPKYRMDVLMVDNSRLKGYDKYLSGFDIITRHVNPKNKNSVEFICDSHNAIREFFLWNKYDYLLHLESDVMIETQTLRTLIFHAQQNDLPVVSACYFHGENDNTNLLLHKLEYYGNSKTVMPMGYKEASLSCGKFFQIYGSGIGCCLIRRDVLENLSFRFNSKENNHPDTYFYEDLFHKNIPVYVDTSLILKHKSQDWGQNLDYYKPFSKNK